MNRNPNSSHNERTHKRSLNKLIPILFENDQVVVFDKPAGLIVIPSPKKEKTTLVSEVNTQFEEAEYNLHPCHRLDKETSGVIMFAKGKRNQQMMMDLFKRQEIDKLYLALVQGQMKKKSGEIQGLISMPNKLKYKNKSQPKYAKSIYRVIKQKKEYSIVEVKPVTGRTNQIRIQFSQLGHPLLGDRKFSIAKNYTLKFKRTALHALSLKWSDPETKEKIHVKSNLPNDMEVFCARN